MKGVYSQPDNVLGRVSQQAGLLTIYSVSRVLESPSLPVSQVLLLTCLLHALTHLDSLISRRLYFLTTRMAWTVEATRKWYPILPMNDLRFVPFLRFGLVVNRLRRCFYCPKSIGSRADLSAALQSIKTRRSIVLVGQLVPKGSIFSTRSIELWLLIERQDRRTARCSEPRFTPQYGDKVFFANSSVSQDRFMSSCVRRLFCKF